MGRDKTPTPEMREFAKDAVRVNALNRSGLSTNEDIARLTQLAREAQAAQKKANEQ